MMLYPKAEKLSFVLFLLLVFLIKLACDNYWRLDDALLQEMAEFQAEQLRQDSLQEVERQRRAALSAARRPSTQSPRTAPLAPPKTATPARVKNANFPAIDKKTTTTPSEPLSLNLNRVDSLGLLAVKGIGAYSASKILAYRRALGGFVSIDQLDEIEALRPENVQALKNVAHIDLSQDTLARLRLNQASFKELLHHPYLSYSQVVAIVNRRREFGRIDSLEVLGFMEEFSPKDLHRLGPYVDFH